jgi:hypothetical protein
MSLNRNVMLLSLIVAGLAMPPLAANAEQPTKLLLDKTSPISASPGLPPPIRPTARRSDASKIAVESTAESLLRDSADSVTVSSRTVPTPPRRGALEPVAVSPRPISDFSKFRVELPAKALFRSTDDQSSLIDSSRPALPYSAPPENPQLSVSATLLRSSRSTRASDNSPYATRPHRVRPGLIDWHDSFSAALTASKTSHKPVLLFHMMGFLDQEFC